METTTIGFRKGLYQGNIGIVQKKMETTIGFKMVYGLGTLITTFLDVQIIFFFPGPKSQSLKPHLETLDPKR